MFIRSNSLDLGGDVAIRGIANVADHSDGSDCSADRSFRLARNGIRVGGIRSGWDNLTRNKAQAETGILGAYRIGLFLNVRVNSLLRIDLKNFRRTTH
jgi:hypothetical protein